MDLSWLIWLAKGLNPNPQKKSRPHPKDDRIYYATLCAILILAMVFAVTNFNGPTEFADDGIYTSLAYTNIHGAVNAAYPIPFFGENAQSGSVIDKVPGNHAHKPFLSGVRRIGALRLRVGDNLLPPDHSGCLLHGAETAVTRLEHWPLCSSPSNRRS